MNSALHRILIAAGLARVYDQMIQGPFAIISAANGDRSSIENDQRTDMLKVELRQLGYGFLPATGMWDGGQEPSIFVPDIPRDVAQALAEKYTQIEYLWGDGGQYQKVKTATGEVIETGPVSDKFHHLEPGEVIPEGYTEIKNNPKMKFRLGKIVIDSPITVANKTMDTDRKGSPFFFVWDPAFKYAGPRFGVGVEDHPSGALGDKHKIVYSDDQRAWWSVKAMVVYLPLSPNRTLKSAWKGRRRCAVIADGWRQMLSKQGSIEHVGQEQIIDKFWIDPQGAVIHHGMGETHQEYARRWLKENEGWKGSGDQNRDTLKAEGMFLERGYIRGQVYSHGGLGLQGKEDALKTRGHAALQIVPKPRRAYIALWPEGETSMYMAQDLKQFWGQG